MKIRKFALLATLLAALAVPALAPAGKRVKPPEDASYRAAKSDNGGHTQADRDKNKVAERIDLTIELNKCGSVEPFDRSNIKINRRGVYKFKGKLKNFRGDRFNLNVRGKFKSKKKIVEKVTIKKGPCKKTKKFVLKRSS